MILTLAAARAVFPKADEAWLKALVAELADTNIFTQPNELASFLAQLDHESNGLTVFKENLNYSAARMAQVWKRFAANPDENDLSKRVPNDLARKYERNPKALANFIYANRMGNGNETSGDGWNFSGKGPTMLTGRDNYDKCGTAIGSDLINYPELLLLPAHGIRSAIWFWLANDLDQLDNDTDVRLETRKINGGETGLAHRQALFDRCLGIINKERTA